MTPPPFRGFYFFKVDGNGGDGGGGAKNICWKRWGKAGGLSRNGEIAVLYGGFSGDSSWCYIEKKSWWVYLFFINKHMLQNNLFSINKQITITSILMRALTKFCVCFIRIDTKIFLWWTKSPTNSECWTLT